MEELEILVGTKIHTIRDAPIGLLYLVGNSSIIMKTEYHTDGKPDCFIVESGEAYCGDLDEPCKILKIYE